ncbi:MAG: hypothetical protein AAF950_09695 [Pseudomonadota bacterium]
MRKRMFLACLFAAASSTFCEAEEIVVPAQHHAENRAQVQEDCIVFMAGFPDHGHVARYQFFRLTEAMAADVTPDFQAVLDAYGEGEVAPETPIVDVVEGIANPVIRQAAPSLAVAQTAHLISFAKTCQPFITGQASSLEAFDGTLADANFNQVVEEDALFLRQVLSDVLFRLQADEDPSHSAAVLAYADALVITRNRIEFTAFDSEVDSIEALFMADLDGRLARSNDIINEDMNADSVSSAIGLADDLNQATRDTHKQAMRLTLARILLGG